MFTLTSVGNAPLESTLSVNSSTSEWPLLQPSSEPQADPGTPGEGVRTCSAGPNRGRLRCECLPGDRCFCAHYEKQIQLQFIPDQRNAVSVNIIITSYIVIYLKTDTSLNLSIGNPANCPPDPSLCFHPPWCLPKYPDRCEPGSMLKKLRFLLYTRN